MSEIPVAPPNLRGAIDLSALVNKSSADTEGSVGSEATLELPGLLFDGTESNIEQFLQLSTRVPVIMALVSTSNESDQQLVAVLDRVVTSRSGQTVLVRVDIDSQPQLAQAFQAQTVPTVAAIVAGRPVQLFSGQQSEEVISDVVEQLVALAAQNGVRERVRVTGQPDPVADTRDDNGEPMPQEEALPPHHAEAQAAIERGDYDTAIAEYKTALAQDPRDQLAVAALAQVGLLARLVGVNDVALWQSAAENPADVDHQLAVADLDIAGGHVVDAFDRLLSLFPRLAGQDRETVRLRLIDYFEIVGAPDPRVVAARGRLTSLLY